MSISPSLLKSSMMTDPHMSGKSTRGGGDVPESRYFFPWLMAAGSISQATGNILRIATYLHVRYIEQPAGKPGHHQDTSPGSVRVQFNGSSCTCLVPVLCLFRQREYAGFFRCGSEYNLSLQHTSENAIPLEASHFLLNLLSTFLLVISASKRSIHCMAVSIYVRS